VNTPPPDHVPAELVADLVQAMLAMRDAMLKASLLLHDYQFDHDRAGRDEAAAHSDDCIDKARSR
jgi:hypothetical protein